MVVDAIATSKIADQIPKVLCNAYVLERASDTRAALLGLFRRIFSQSQVPDSVENSSDQPSTSMTHRPGVPAKKLA